MTKPASKTMKVAVVCPAGHAVKKSVVYLSLRNAARCPECWATVNLESAENARVIEEARAECKRLDAARGVNQG